MSKNRSENGNGNGAWAVDKRISVATGINLCQLVAIVWFGATFYAQVNSNQDRNEERFKEVSDARRVQADQMTKMQDAQTEMMMQFTKFSSDTNAQLTAQVLAIKEMRESQVEISKDIRDLLRPKSIVQ